MITYQPSPHFKQSLKDLAPYIKIKWVEESETLEIWSVLPNKIPVMEHNYCRNNKIRKRPLYNWDMEWIVLGQLERGRRFQHMSAGEFSDSMEADRLKTKEQGEAVADAEMNDFMTDPYWMKKKEQERENGDFGACKTVWSGASTNTSEGDKNDNVYLESK